MRAPLAPRAAARERLQIFAAFAARSAAAYVALRAVWVMPGVVIP